MMASRPCTDRNTFVSWDMVVRISRAIIVYDKREEELPGDFYHGMASSGKGVSSNPLGFSLTIGYGISESRATRFVDDPYAPLDALSPLWPLHPVVRAHRDRRVISSWTDWSKYMAMGLTRILLSWAQQWSLSWWNQYWIMRDNTNTTSPSFGYKITMKKKCWYMYKKSDSFGDLKDRETTYTLSHDLQSA